MKFPFLSSLTPATSGTTFMGLGPATSSTTEAAVQVPVPACSLVDLPCFVQTAPGVGASWTIMVRDNAGNTLATNIISDTNLTPVVPWNGSLVPVSFADGDMVSISVVPSTVVVPAATAMSILTMWSTTGQTAFICGLAMTSSAVSNTTDTFCALTGIASGGGISETSFGACPMACTWTAFRSVTNGGSPGGGTKQYATSLRINGSDVLTATVVNAATTALTTGSVAGSVFDKLDVHIQPSNTPTARRISWYAQFIPANNGESMMLLSNNNIPPGTGTLYNVPLGVGNTWSAVESGRTLLLGPALVLRNLTFVCSTAPGGSTGRKLTSRDNLASTALTCTITGAATTAQDTTHTVTMTGGMAAWDIQHANINGTPATGVAGDLAIGYVIVTAQGGGAQLVMLL